ncbi:MAG: hypothetical protein GX434_02320 [Peptococcaceae bacterium]|nr:hypothetical protein [Peptococcaceae bacterium]
MEQEKRNNDQGNNIIKIFGGKNNKSAKSSRTMEPIPVGISDRKISAHKFIHIQRGKINPKNESYQQYPQGAVYNFGGI